MLRPRLGRYLSKGRVDRPTNHDMTKEEGMQHTLRTKRVLLGGAFALGVVLAAAGMGGALSANAHADEAATSAPAIKVVDGQMVQRTPDGAYNVEVLRGDQRGCGACHEDLAELVLGLYPQHNPSQGLKATEQNVEQCMSCHSAGLGENMGVMLHGIHGVNMGGTPTAECFNCHTTNGEGELVLWEQAKYSQFQGISSVADVQGAFAWDQDYTVSADEMPNAQWLSGSNYYNWMRFNNQQDDVPLDQETFDTWEISVTGLVGEEKTWTLPELIEQAPVAHSVLSAQCTINPLGGEAVAQVEVTGIPLQWMLDQAGLDPEAASVTWYTPQGSYAGYTGLSLSEMGEHEVYLVYEINGEPLSWNNGYPCVLWAGGFAADHISKNLSEIRIVADDYTVGGPIVPVGGPMAEGGIQGTGKPNLGFLNTLEGRVIQAGEPCVFEGWADGFELNIAALEFSMDGGATWTTFETPDANVNRWVHWTFEWTPEEGVDTAYVLQARAVADDGRVTEVPVSVMVNAKTEMPEL